MVLVQHHARGHVHLEAFLKGGVVALALHARLVLGAAVVFPLLQA